MNIVQNYAAQQERIFFFKYWANMEIFLKNKIAAGLTHEKEKKKTALIETPSLLTRHRPVAIMKRQKKKKMA